MADIKLDFAWAIEADGELSISVHPGKNRDVVLGEMTLDEDLFMDELSEDLNEFNRTGDAVPLTEWELLSDMLMDLSLKITARINTAKDEHYARKATRDFSNLVKK